MRLELSHHPVLPIPSTQNGDVEIITTTQADKTHSDKSVDIFPNVNHNWIRTAAFHRPFSPASCHYLV